MARKRARTSPKSQPSSVTLPGELVVVTRRAAAFRWSAGRFESASGQNVSDLAALLKRHGARMQPIFGATEERVMARQAAHPAAVHAPTEDLSVFYRVEAPTERLAELRDRLAASEHVDAAFIKPSTELPIINEMAAAPEEPPPASPDFTARQIYLNAAPAGVDARWAWTQSGGRG